MTREDRRKAFIDRRKHLLAGIVCDAISNRERQGGDLAIFLRSAMTRIDNEIGSMFDELIPKEKESAPSPPPTQPVNGSAHPARK